MFLNQLPMTMMLQMLTQNDVGIFSFTTQDFPTGVTRAALLTAFNALAGNPSNFDPAGNWNTQAHIPGNNQDGESGAESRTIVTPAVTVVQAALPNGASGYPPTIALVNGPTTGSTLTGGQNPGIGIGAQTMAANNDLINTPSAVV
jgi:hypothetical protein